MRKLCAFQIRFPLYRQSSFRFRAKGSDSQGSINPIEAHDREFHETRIKDWLPDHIIDAHDVEACTNYVRETPIIDLHLSVQ